MPVADSRVYFRAVPSPQCLLSPLLAPWPSHHSPPRQWFWLEPGQVVLPYTWLPNDRIRGFRNVTALVLYRKSASVNAHVLSDSQHTFSRFVPQTKPSHVSSQTTLMTRKEGATLSFQCHTTAPLSATATTVSLMVSKTALFLFSETANTQSYTGSVVSTDFRPTDKDPNVHMVVDRPRCSVSITNAPLGSARLLGCHCP